jgi:hypothetical protein
MVQNYFRPEPTTDPNTPDPEEPNTNPENPPADDPSTDPADPSTTSPKPKVTVAQKMLEKPEGMSFREWIVSQMSESTSSRRYEINEINKQ